MNGGANMKLGEKYSFKLKNKQGPKSPPVYTGKIVYIHPDDRYIVIDTGKYRVSILDVDLAIGEVEVRGIG